MQGVASMSGWLHGGHLLRHTYSPACLANGVRYRSRSHYDVLGVADSCSDKQLRDAYVQLSKKMHPDISPGSHAEFVLINEAYQTLSRRHSRALYDASLRRAAAAPPDGARWQRHGNMETTAPPERVFYDDSIWPGRGATGQKPRWYYGISGLPKLSNGAILLLCLAWMAVGVAFHSIVIKSGHQSAVSYVEEKNRKLFAKYTESKERAIDTKDKQEVARFLQSISKSSEE